MNFQILGKTDEPNGGIKIKRIREGKKTEKDLTTTGHAMVAENLNHEVPVEVNGRMTNFTAPDHVKENGVDCKKKGVDSTKKNAKDEKRKRAIQIDALPMKCKKPTTKSHQNIGAHELTVNFE